ncbi:MAG: hypothetical protein DMG39_19005 [Acidobacteria bacterium]|nr:MAG: hypothetical protein DMG39_19005 [Acidobacteriota bacterium]
MPTLTGLIQSATVCHRLREKKMYYEGGDAPANSMDIISSAEKAAQMPTGPFWCAQTQSLVGPDGGFANAEKCRPGRSCCETT